MPFFFSPVLLRNIQTATCILLLITHHVVHAWLIILSVFAVTTCSNIKRHTRVFSCLQRTRYYMRGSSFRTFSRSFFFLPWYYTIKYTDVDARIVTLTLLYNVPISPAPPRKIGAIAVKPFWFSDPLRRSRVTKVLDMINRPGGGPLQAFCRSSTTFTSTLLWSSKFCPYVPVRCCSPQTSSRSSLSLTSSGVLQSACCCSQSCFQAHDSTSDELVRFFTVVLWHVRPCCQFLGHDDFWRKNHARSIISGPGYGEQNPREKSELLQPNIKNWDHRENWGVPRKPSKFCLPFFIGRSPQGCWRRKTIRAAVWLYCTALDYCTVLYCTTTALLYCGTLLYEYSYTIDALFYYCTAVYQVLYYCTTVLYCTSVPYLALNFTTVLYWTTVLYRSLLLYYTVQ